MNKNQTWRKVLSLLCAMVMLVGIMVVGSVVASAAETEYVAYIGEQGYTSLKSAVAACTDSGDYLITMSKNDNTSFTFKKLNGVNITIDGQGYTYGGTITFTADESYTNQVTVFKNVVFKTGNNNCILINSKNVSNVTFDACSFTGSASYSFNFAASQYPNNFKFTNHCVVNMGNGLWQSTCAVSNLVVEDMHIIKVGTAFKFNYGSNAGSNTATFSNVTVDYANIFLYLMSDANIEGIEITNCDINANYPVIRQDKGAYNYHLTFRGINNITLNGNNAYNLSTLEGYDYVFVNGVNSNANFTITTVPYYGIIDGTLYEDAAEFEAALKALKNHLHEDHTHKIVLGQDCAVNFDIGEHRENGGELGAHVVLDLNGHKYTGKITLHNQSELTVEGLADGTTINVVECDPALTRVHHNQINHWIASRHNISYVTTPPTCVEDGYTTYTCENCDYTYTVPGESATGAHNFAFVETVAPTTAAGGYDLYKCSVCGATDKRNLTDPITAVASVNGVEYATLAAALEAAPANATVYLLANVNQNVTINKSITLDGADGVGGRYEYTGTMVLASGKNITIQNVKFVDGGINKSTRDTSGDYHVYNCQFYNNGTYNYAMCFQGANLIDIKGCYVDHYKFGGLYIVSSTVTLNVDGFEVVDCSSYAMAFSSGVNNATIKGLSVTNAYYGVAIANNATRYVNISDITLENVRLAIGDSDDAFAINCNLSGTNSFGTAALSQYAKITLVDSATTLAANQGLEPITNVAGSCVYFADGVYSVNAHTYEDTVTPPTTESQGFTTHTCENCLHSYVDSYVPALSYVAEVNGVKYATLQKAINAANPGDIVYLIDDVNGDVIIDDSIILDGQNNQYTGTMTVNKGLTITIQNVKFVNGGILKSTGSTTGKYTVTNCTFDGANNTYAYAFSFKGADTVIIENCSVKDYMYGFLYVRSGTVTITVKNVSVENCPNYAVYFASGVNNASFEKFTVKNGNRGFLINNTADRTLTVKDCVMEDVNTAVADSNGTLSITCKLLGENNFGGAAISQYASVLLGATDAKLVAPETATVGVVANLAADYRAVFAEDTWFVKAIDFVAEVNGQRFESLQAAIDAAADGAIVKMLKNVEYTYEDVITTSSNLTTIIKVEGKSIILDMNGKKISLVHESTTTRIYSVVYVGNGAGLTVTGNGAIDVTTHETSPKVAYMFLKDGANGSLKIESGYFHMNNSEDSMFYTNADRVITVEDGTFVLDNAGNRANGFPCIFNTKGNNERKIVVTGGSFNVDVNHQYWCFEVQIDTTLALAYDAVTGLWTVVDAVAYVGEIEGLYTHNVGYATIEEAYARAVELGSGFDKLVIFADDTLKSANLFVGSYINVYFNVYKSSFSSAFKYTAYVYDANGNKVAAIPSNLWETHEGSEDLYKINFKNLAAKQMADEFKLVIVCDDERVSLSDNTVESFSVKSYVEKGWGSFTENQQKLLSAMLAYGAAAQEAFDHNKNDLATNVDVTNGLLTVTPVPEQYVGDYSVAMRSYYYGASLTLENTIYFNFKFFADSVQGADYAVITDEKGNVLARVEDFGYDFKQNKDIVVVTFDASVANATQLAKCTFYTEGGTEIVSAQDNILSYCYRAIEGITASGYTGSFGVKFYTALAEYAYAVSTYSASSNKENN